MKFNYNILFISLMIVAVMSCDVDDNGGDAPERDCWQTDF